MARKRIKCSMLCSSENYRASKRMHRAALQRAHEAFNFETLKADSQKVEASEKEEGNKEFDVLDIKHQIALDNRPVKVMLFHRVCTITYKEWKERYESCGMKCLSE